MQSVEGQTQTRQAQIKYDDSYHGKTFLSRNSITLLIPLLSKHAGFLCRLLESENYDLETSPHSL